MENFSYCGIKERICSLDYFSNYDENCPYRPKE